MTEYDVCIIGGGAAGLAEIFVVVAFVVETSSDKIRQRMYQSVYHHHKTNYESQ